MQNLVFIDKTFEKIKSVWKPSLVKYYDVYFIFDILYIFVYSVFCTFLHI